MPNVDSETRSKAKTGHGNVASSLVIRGGDGTYSIRALQPPGAAASPGTEQAAEVRRSNGVVGR